MLNFKGGALLLVQLLDLRLATVPSCWNPFIISNLDIKHLIVVISSVLFSWNYKFIEEFSTKHFCGRLSIQKNLNFPIYLNNWSPLSNAQSKLNVFDMSGNVNNVQVTDMRDRHEHCILLNEPYLTLSWSWVTWTTLITV